jgi:hypothetical protein
MQRYLVRKVSLDELGRISEHLHGCRACYASYLTVLQTRFPVEIDFEELGGLKGWHLEGEELADYVDGTMSELDFNYARLHLKECSPCEQRASAASTNRVEYALSTRRMEEGLSPWREYLSGFLSSTSPRSLLAAALALVIALALLMWIALQPKHSESGIADIPVPETAAPTPSPEPAPVFQPDAGRTSPKVAQHQSGPSTHSAKARVGDRPDDIENALIARDLVMPATIEVFYKSPNLTVRGSTTHIESFSIIGPFSTVITDEQPTFTWSALPGAVSYTVSLYDSDLELVRTSQPLTEARWSVPSRLRRGTVYTWTVAAIRDGKEITAPALPARAEFTVIREPDLLKVNRRINGTVSHAARGVIYAQAGLLDEAEHEFQTHLGLRPEDDRVRELLRTVKSWRGAEPYLPPSPTTTKPAQ